MSDANSVSNQVATGAEGVDKKSEGEGHFAKLRQAKEKAELVAEQERQERLRLQQEVDALRAKHLNPASDDHDDDYDSDGYVDNKHLKRTIKRLENDFDKKVEEKLVKRLEEENRKNFMFKLKSEYQDFDSVLNEETAAKLEQSNPRLAAMILNIPDEYQRRAMAYEAIKTAGLHKKAEPAKQESMQEQIARNQRSPFYIPPSSGHGSAAIGGDFSKEGRKAAYEALKKHKAAITSR